MHADQNAKGCFARFVAIPAVLLALSACTSRTEVADSPAETGAGESYTPLLEPSSDSPNDGSAYEVVPVPPEVTLGPPHRISVQPGGFHRIRPNETRRFRAVVHDVDGNIVEHPVQWHSLNPSSIAVSEDGVLTPLGPTGPFSFTVSAGDVLHDPIAVWIVNDATDEPSIESRLFGSWYAYWDVVGFRSQSEVILTLNFGASNRYQVRGAGFGFRSGDTGTYRVVGGTPDGFRVVFRTDGGAATPMAFSFDADGHLVFHGDRQGASDPVVFQRSGGGGRHDRIDVIDLRP